MESNKEQERQENQEVQPVEVGQVRDLGASRQVVVYRRCDKTKLWVCRKVVGVAGTGARTRLITSDRNLVLPTSELEKGAVYGHGFSSVPAANPHE